MHTSVDLHLELNGRRLRESLTEALRDAVRSGRLAPNTTLPASRALAVDLGIARSTVTASYSDLIEEGWLIARHGSGTRVAERVQPPRPTVESGPAVPKSRAAHELAPGSAEFAEFPRSAWLAASRRALSAAPHSAFGYGDPLGRMELRSALADYLSRARGVIAAPEQIIITSGFHHALSVVARALMTLGVETLAVEGYGLDIYRAVLGDEGLSIPALGVDESGARVDELVRMPEAGAVLLTPAHQFPTGFALSADRRSSALDWALRTGGFVLEDDYDGEFRYDRKPVGALQGLDPERVVYFGTASKSLAPALRMAWMVVPERLLPAVAASKGRVESVSVLDQLTLAEFITSGAFDRHVRERRQRYRRRREELIAALSTRAPDIHLAGMQAGLQAVLVLPRGTEAHALATAARRGLVVSGMAEFRHPAAGPDLAHQDAIVVNFSSVSDSAWQGALDALCGVLG